MIFYFCRGQLGNQLFQCAYMIHEAEKTNQSVVLFNCDELFNHVDIRADVPVYRVRERGCFLFWLLKYILFPFGRLLGGLRLFGVVRQEEDRVGGYRIYSKKVFRRCGLFSVSFARQGFFQYDYLANVGRRIFELKPRLLREAQHWFESNGMSPAHSSFLHIRRGDYVKWTVLGRENPTPPLAYFEKALELLDINTQTPGIALLGDDVEYLQRCRFDAGNCMISDNPVGVDFAIMVLCSGAIISPSSLAWWGAVLGEKPGGVVAPKYWLGWQSAIWYPRGLEASPFIWCTIEQSH